METSQKNGPEPIEKKVEAENYHIYTSTTNLFRGL